MSNNNSKLNLFLSNINKYKTDTFIDSENYKKIIKNISSDDFNYKNIRVSDQFVNDLLKFFFSTENPSKSFVRKFDLASKKIIFEEMQKMKWIPNISENDAADSNDNWSEQKINFLDNLFEVANDKISIDTTSLDTQKLKNQFLFEFLNKNNQEIFENHWPSDLKKMNNEKNIGDLLKYLSSLKHELNADPIEGIDSNFRSIKKLNNLTWNNLKNKCEFIKQSQDFDNINNIIVKERFEDCLRNFIINNFSEIKNKDNLYKYLNNSILKVGGQITENILSGLDDDEVEKIIDDLKEKKENDFGVYIKLIKKVSIALENAADFKKIINDRIYKDINNKKLNIKKQEVFKSIEYFNNENQNLYEAFQKQYDWREDVSYKGEEWVSTRMPISEIINGNFYIQYIDENEDGNATPKEDSKIKISPEDLLDIFENSEISFLKKIFESSANTTIYKTLVGISKYIRSKSNCKNINFIDFQINSENGETVKDKNKTLFEKHVKNSSWKNIEKQKIWNKNWELEFKKIKEEFENIKSLIKDIEPEWEYTKEMKIKTKPVSFNLLNQLHLDKIKELNELNNKIHAWIDANHSEKNLSKKHEWISKIENSMKKIKDNNSRKVDLVNKLINILKEFEGSEHNEYTCDEIVGIEDPNLKNTKESLESLKNKIEAIAKSQEFKEKKDEQNKSIACLIKWFKENSQITNIDKLQKAFKSQDFSEVIENYLLAQKTYIHFFKEKNDVIAKWSIDLKVLTKNLPIPFEHINLKPLSLKELNTSKNEIMILETEAKKRKSRKENIKAKKK